MNPDNRIALRLRDILRAVSGIHSTVAGIRFQTYTEVWHIKHASERGVEIISEASRHIPDSLKETEPEIPWPQIAAVGNVPRHEYQTISDHVVWDIITNHLVPLEAAVLRLMQRLEGTANTEDAS